MSDFDKEAEREKLREKYERDQQERQATQRMSDLLLKGATMTNSHCGTCGDPLFQLDGTTFCPSCHGNPDAVEGTALEAQPEGEGEAASGGSANTETGSESESRPASGPVDDAGTTEAGTNASPRPGSEAQANESAGQQRSADVRSASAAEPPTPDETDERPSPTTQSGSRTASGGRDTDRPTGDEPRSSGRRSGSGSAPDSAAVRDGDLEAARDSLVAALEKFAAEAAAADDPRYAKECLEAAREAGEALETLR